MRADELHENDAVRVVDGCNEPVLVAGDIEDNSAVLQNTRRAEVGLYVSWGLPFGFEDMAMPSEERLFGVGMLRSFVEGPKGG